jgi:hypothetical protein
MKVLTKSTPQIIRFSGFFIFMMLFTFPAHSGSSDKTFFEGSIKLNPECRVKRLSTGDVLVFAKNNNGTDIEHKFTDFYADLIMAAYRKQRTEFIVDSLGKKYYLSEADCRREIKHALNVLIEWKILYRDDQVASR